jgi:fumarate reductase subunit C
MFKPQWTTAVLSDPLVITMNVIIYIGSICLTTNCYFNKHMQAMNQICSGQDLVYYTCSKYGEIT